MLSVESNSSLKSLNTFGIDVSTRYLAEIETAEDLITLLQLSHLNELPILVIGSGSNVLFTQDFAGLVIKNNTKGIQLLRETDEHVWVRVGAGENWHDFVQYSLSNHWYGIENLSLIPGTVGAAPIQNIGAYGVELKDVFASLEALDLKTQKVVHFFRDDCQFGYRHSVFKESTHKNFFILSVEFKLNKIPDLKTTYGDIQKTLRQMNIALPTPQEVSQAVIRIRKSKLPDPSEIGNAGSFFKNPIISIQQYEKLKGNFEDMPNYPTEQHDLVKVPAGWLIEQAGWKGKRVGNAGVHSKQALVLVNHGNALGVELKQLSERIQASVQDKYGISLQPEVNFF